ncbi:MAG TPA: RNA methyltransferase [Acidimicrobiia bacterium]|jgi:TrmH family RNA methyltransferase|nr:RNA methyltransferase [Acidimicrobiia bacterium]
MEPVRTHRARTVVEAARLHRARERKARRLTLLEGPELLRDVAATGANVLEVFGEGGTPVDERALQRLAGTKTPRGPVAVVQIPVERLDRSRNLLVAVGVSDPGNVGALVRTAAAFGWGFAYTPGSADPWSPKSIRAGAGGQFQTPVAAIDAIDVLGEWTTVATLPRGGKDPSKVTERPVAVLIGEEAHGLDDATLSAAAHLVTIPTPGVTDSLNASVAAGIAVYTLSRGSGETGAGV